MFINVKLGLSGYLKWKTEGLLVGHEDFDRWVFLLKHKMFELELTKFIYELFGNLKYNDQTSQSVAHLISNMTKQSEPFVKHYHIEFRILSSFSTVYGYFCGDGLRTVITEWDCGSRDSI